MYLTKNILIASVSACLISGCGEISTTETLENSDSNKTAMLGGQSMKDLSYCGESPVVETEEGHSMEVLSIEKRVAFMSGHVETGLALYRAGKPDQAAKHLLHPVSETHQAERAGIDALGFTPEVFKSVSKALEEGKPASEIEPMLSKAEENIYLLQKNAGGDVDEIIEFLMESVVEEYNAGVNDGKIVEPGEYQDAFGFALVALKMSKRTEHGKSEQLIEELTKLVKIWPEGGPIAESIPEPVEDVVEQTNIVVRNL